MLYGYHHIGRITARCVCRSDFPLGDEPLPEVGHHLRAVAHTESGLRAVHRIGRYRHHRAAFPHLTLKAARDFEDEVGIALFHQSQGMGKGRHGGTQVKLRRGAHLLHQSAGEHTAGMVDHHNRKVTHLLIGRMGKHEHHHEGHEEEQLGEKRVAKELLELLRQKIAKHKKVSVEKAENKPYSKRSL